MSLNYIHNTDHLDEIRWQSVLVYSKLAILLKCHSPKDSAKGINRSSTIRLEAQIIVLNALSRLLFDPTLLLFRPFGLVSGHYLWQVDFAPNSWP